MVRVILALALCVVLQLLATRRNVRIDFTPAQIFTLSGTARQVAAGFTRPVNIVAFYNSQTAGMRSEMADTLSQFAAVAPSLTYQIVDLDRSPALASKYGVSSYNTAIIEVGDEVVRLRSVDEADITGALLSLSRDRSRAVCFITGHGERSPADSDDRSGYSQLARALADERFAVEELTTIPSAGVPEACTVLVLAGPSKDLLPGETEALRRFLDGGGRALALVDPDAPPTMLAFLQGLGVDARSALIVDQQDRLVGTDSFMPAVVGFRPEVFRDAMTAAVILSLARPVGTFENKPENVRVTSIAQTGPDSFALVGSLQPPDGEPRFRRELDEPGPISVGVLVEMPPRAGGTVPGQLIVLGDSDFATNLYLNVLGNRDLIMSAIAFLSQDPDLIAVRRKAESSTGSAPLTLTSAQTDRLRVVAVFMLPALTLLIGAAVGWRRLRQRGGR